MCKKMNKNLNDIFDAYQDILMFLMVIIWILGGISFFSYLNYTKIYDKLEDIQCRVENIENK